MALFDENGVTIATKSQILNELILKAKEIYGQDILIEEGTPDYTFLDFIADNLYEVESALLALYQSLSPGSASGISLDNLVALNGIARVSEIKSTVDITITGVATTNIPAGVVRDVSDNLWDLPANTVIGAGGTVIVTAIAQESGAIVVLAGEVTIIVTPVAGWTSVTNASAGSSGEEIEADSQLRTRRSLSVGLTAVTPVQSLLGAILQIANVTDAIIFENDTAAGVLLKGGVDTLPAHSITAVILGGDNQDLGGIIRDKKNLGCGTYGDQTVALIDSLGISTDYKFERPDTTAIYVAITIQTLTGYVITTDDLIKQALVDVIDALPIASDVVSGDLYNAVYSADPLSDGRRTFNITVLDFNDAAAPTTSVPVVLDWNKTADAILGNMDLTKV